jgi:hypothetical protein
MMFWAIFGAPILIGIAAQLGKGRTGVGWALIAFVFEGLAWAFIVFVLASTPESWRSMQHPNSDLVVIIMAALATLFVMGIVVATLPDRRVGRETAGDTRPCPYCTEPIKLAAKRCRWCAADVTAWGDPAARNQRPE